VKTWFITGTSTGFGRIMTEKLLARGDRVAATLRTPSLLDGLKQQYGDKLWVATLDVTDTAAIGTVMQKAFGAFGKIDVIVNNAGYALFGAAEELQDDQIKHQIDTNVIGSIQVTRAAIPYLRAQGGGRIMQVSSMGGQIGLPGLSLYHASKWAIEGFFESVIQEIAPFGIDVTIVQPAGAKTNFISTGLVSAAPLPVYMDTVVGERRRLYASADFNPALDPEKAVEAMIQSVNTIPAPKRLTLGGSAFSLVHAALTDRLALLESQRQMATEMDHS
jgi:NAD(P)-dependent dehydrogenase (short-subunit alcohol dehydrogenase family)